VCCHPYGSPPHHSDELPLWGLLHGAAIGRVRAKKGQSRASGEGGGCRGGDTRSLCASFWFNRSRACRLGPPARCKRRDQCVLLVGRCFGCVCQSTATAARLENDGCRWLARGMKGVRVASNAALHVCSYVCCPAPLARVRRIVPCLCTHYCMHMDGCCCLRFLCVR